RAAWSPFVDEFDTDGLGSLIAIKRGSGPEPRRKIMLCAHMDEIALIVAEIDGAFIRTGPLGGIDYRPLLAQPVLVHGRRTLKGVFGAAPPHMATDRKKYPSSFDLWVDVGLPAEDLNQLVRVGDLITFDAPFIELKSKRTAGKSLDNRASVAALTLCLDELTRRSHAWDVVAVASVQEEVGCYGAIAAAYKIQPDMAVAIDGTFGLQRGVDDDEGFALGSGPTIGRGPNFQPHLVKMLRDLAKDLEIKVQLEVLPGNSGTDAWFIQVSRDGVPSLLVSIPLRSMHTPAEVVDLRDITRAARLLAAFVAGLDPDVLDKIAWTQQETEEDDDE
ncbi:MAG: M20/M25/M40 family metallo-hydrolase, partial [Chloroflexi bacterium]|nr:M20/M25/M40 family metallo-hydrolase [Chloroflexota bacterium]